MSEQDNFESLSNAEIRAKCIQYGLPNIPVTDSSRKVLIKKLRVSIGGTGTGAAGVGATAGNNVTVPSASPKKQHRRETAVVKQIFENKSTDSKATNNLDAKDNQQRNKGRRPNESDVRESASTQSSQSPPNEIRGLKINLAKSSTTLGASAKAEEKKSIPQVRRKSVQPEEIGSQRATISRIPQRRESVQEEDETTKIANSQKSIEERHKSVERPLPPSQRQNVNVPSMPLIKENVLLSNSLIVLESDEEEEAQLARAAKIVEDNVQQQELPPMRHQKKLGKAVGTISAAAARETSSLYYGGSSKIKESTAASQPMPHHITSIGSGLSKETVPSIASIGSKSTLYGSNLSQMTSASSGISASSLQATIDRFNSAGGNYSSPLVQRYSSLAASAIASSPFASGNQSRPPTLVSSNEFSDDADDVEKEQSPYLSTFARNLERMKSTPIAERGSFRSGTPRNRRTVGGFGNNYEPEVRRPLRSAAENEDNEVSGALNNFIQTLNRKYHLKSKLIILFVIVFITIIYVLLF